MFTQLSDRLSNSLQKLRGIKKFTEDNIKETVSEVRRALIEADVALSVITDFTHHIKEKALGQCLVHEKFYCCYGSVLLRDVREGVLTQLHLGFGKKTHPHCRGISLSQLQRLDFTTLHLREAVKPPVTLLSPALSEKLTLRREAS